MIVRSFRFLTDFCVFYKFLSDRFPKRKGPDGTFFSIIQMSQFPFSYKTWPLYHDAHNIYFLNYLKIKNKIRNSELEIYKIERAPRNSFIRAQTAQTYKFLIEFCQFSNTYQR